MNEAMAAGCAVVVSSLVGSAPFLIRDGVDGLIFGSGSLDGLEAAVTRLAEDPALMLSLGVSARERVRGPWGATEAADRLLAYCDGVLRGAAEPFADDGPLSLAPVLEDDWFSRSPGGSHA